MTRYTLALLVFAIACHAKPGAPDAGILDAGSVASTPLPTLDAGRRLRSSQPGHIRRAINFVDDGGSITTTVSDNDTTGQQDVTINFVGATGGVTSVSGTSGVSCSPTTGAVSCSNTGVTSVTGAGTVSCSPTTGAVTCTGSAGGVTGSGTAHDVAVWATSSSIGAVAGSTNGQPLLWISSSADPTFAALNLSGSGITSTLPHGNGGTDVTSPGASGNVLTSNGTSWTSAAAVLPSSAFVAGSTTVALGAGITTIASASLTVPSGKNIAISIAWQFDNSNPGSDFNGMTYGYGLASGSYVRTGTVSIPMHNGSRLDGVTDGFAAGAMQAQATSSGGSITVFASATGNSDTAIGVNAQILLIETN